MDTAQRRALILSVATAWVALDMVRAAGPLLSDLFDIGVTVAAGSGLATFAGAGVLAWIAGLLGRRLGHGVVLLSAAALVVAIRVAFPFLSADTLIAVGLIGTSLALALVVLAALTAVAAGGGGTALAGAALGLCVALLEQNVLRTWDAVWRDDALGWAFIALASVVLLFAAYRAREGASGAPAAGWWAYGLWWSLAIFAFGSLPFATAQSEVRMSIGTFIAVLGMAAGATLAERGAGLTAVPLAAACMVGAAALAVVMFIPGVGALIAFAPAGALVTFAASRVLRPGAAQYSGASLRLLGAGVAFGLTALLPFMLVQLDYDMPLGFPHFAVLVAAAVIIAIAGALSSRRRITPEGHQHTAPQRAEFWRSPAGAGVAGSVALALVAAVVTTVQYERADRAYTEEFRSGHPVLSWNIHYGVTPGLAGGPHVDLDEIVATIRDSGAEVVLLQEVNRGWTLAGGTDVLEYIAGELDWEYAYVPAHDSEFGNAIFSARPLQNVQTVELPYGAGPQRRSALIATVDAVTYVVTHLQHKDDSATRVAQATALLEALGGAESVVVAGDFNDVPESEVFALMTGAGFESAQDLLAPDEDTYVGADFNARIDYIFGRGILFTDFSVNQAPWSDHLGLQVTTAATVP